MSNLDQPNAGRTPLPVLQLGRPGEDTLTARLEITVGDERMRLEIAVPPGPTAVREMLPVFQGLTDAAVGVAVRDVERAGDAISCKAGCGACCRQIVPVTEAEARDLAELVRDFPEARRARVRDRIDHMRRRLTEARLLEPLQNLATMSADQLLALGRAYFPLGLACPFLEDESCSIYADRPLSCREYLVVTPAENCARPTPDSVKVVPMLVKFSRRVRQLEMTVRQTKTDWVPLFLAVDWAEAHPEEAPTHTGRQLLEELFNRKADAS